MFYTKEKKNLALKRFEKKARIIIRYCHMLNISILNTYVAKIITSF